MSATRVDLPQWRELYETASRVRALAPWRFMEETDLFGVEDPVSGEAGFVSVMGSLGEHHAVALYLGTSGLYEFLSIEASPHEVPPERFLDLPQLQVSFENRSALEQEDRDLTATLGLTFRGRRAWPVFRSYRPSCLPWFLEAGEVRRLQQALEQLLLVGARFREDPSCLSSHATNELLIRSLAPGGGTRRWRESLVTVAPPKPETVEPKIERSLSDAVRLLPRAENPIEIDCFRTPTIVSEQSGRPFFPHALIIGDTPSGMLLTCELLTPTPTLARMWGDLPGRILEQFKEWGWVPNRILVKTGPLASLLKKLGPEFGFVVREVKRLGAVDPARKALLEDLDSQRRRPRTGRGKKKES